MWSRPQHFVFFGETLLPFCGSVVVLRGTQDRQLFHQKNYRPLKAKYYTHTYIYINIHTCLNIYIYIYMFFVHIHFSEIYIYIFCFVHVTCTYYKKYIYMHSPLTWSHTNHTVWWPNSYTSSYSTYIGTFQGCWLNPVLGMFKLISFATHWFPSI